MTTLSEKIRHLSVTNTVNKYCVKISAKNLRSVMIRVAVQGIPVLRYTAAANLYLLSVAGGPATTTQYKRKDPDCIFIVSL